MSATRKPLRGGWAATLKSAGRQGQPVRMDDPRYLNRLRYVGAILLRMELQDHYHEAIHARYSQEAV